MGKFFADHPNEDVNDWFVLIKIEAGICWSSLDYDRDEKKLTVCLDEGLNINVSEMGDQGRNYQSLLRFFEKIYKEHSQVTDIPIRPSNVRGGRNPADINF